ncbi:MAG: helix-turn-helix transcriptional regulator [Candidatus Eremiobacteraeota bacterium]|nr:helix-turn-helix transcriptional regulator [Candidatus Eremiobacteraeota bacterium]
MLKVFLGKDFYYFQSRGISTQVHNQIAHQISVVGPGDTLTWDGHDGVGCYFPSSVPHELGSEGTLHTFLLNPVHARSRLLSRCHEASCGFDPGNETREMLANLAFQPSDTRLLSDCLVELTSLLMTENVVEEPLDERIAEALAYIDELETKRVAAGELAEQLSLSESRFLHLFKEEMQMTVRKYLMWRRTMDGAIMVVRGASITEAAHATGFTDSAHFARVFKQIFGLTLSSALDRQPPPILVVGEY